MKSTNHFKNTIQAYLDKLAASDPMFEWKYTSTDKNLDDCVTYILNWVQKSGCNGFTDDEIFGQAVHYFDETDIEIGNPIDCQVVVNHTVVLTEQEKEQARRDAIQRAQDEAYAQLKQPTKKTTKPTSTTTQPNLFE